MPAPLPLPIRVLVKGASTVLWTSYMSGPRTDFTFPRVIEDELLAAGQPAVVQVAAKLGERAKTPLSVWDHEVLTWSPDVVVLIYGHYETIHLFLPWWLERHANSQRARPGKVRSFYREHLLRPVWRVLLTVQAALDERVRARLFGARSRRVADDITHLVRNCQQVGSPLMVIVDLVPPGRTSAWPRWFPGMAPRIEVINQVLSETVERIGMSNVRLFKASALADDYEKGGSVAAPDGGHFTPELHRLLGKALSEQILGWATTQPHLLSRRQPTEEAARTS